MTPEARFRLERALDAQGHFTIIENQARAFLAKYRRYAKDPAPGEQEPAPEVLTPSRLEAERLRAWPDGSVHAEIDFVRMQVMVTTTYHPVGLFDNVVIQEIGDNG
jgi:hypothetical protein